VSKRKHIAAAAVHDVPKHRTHKLIVTNRRTPSVACAAALPALLPLLLQ
jgi:hypothetical protein